MYAAVQVLLYVAGVAAQCAQCREHALVGAHYVVGRLGACFLHERAERTIAVELIERLLHLHAQASHLALHCDAHFGGAPIDVLVHHLADAHFVCGAIELQAFAVVDVARGKANISIADKLEDLVYLRLEVTLFIEHGNAGLALEGLHRLTADFRCEVLVGNGAVPNLEAVLGFQGRHEHRLGACHDGRFNGYRVQAAYLVVQADRAVNLELIALDGVLLSDLRTEEAAEFVALDNHAIKAGILIFANELEVVEHEAVVTGGV